MAGRGTCRALCGHTVHTAPLVCSAGQPCQRCASHPDVVHAERGAHHPPSRGRRAWRRGWLQRLLGQQAAVVVSTAARTTSGPPGRE